MRFGPKIEDVLIPHVVSVLETVSRELRGVADPISYLTLLQNIFKVVSPSAANRLVRH